MAEIESGPDKQRHFAISRKTGGTQHGAVATDRDDQIGVGCHIGIVYRPCRKGCGSVRKANNLDTGFS